ncbi:molybdate-anion transporter-like [Lycorma delicatula]|uniref:molybdate-anion transporter-like n=1 Tax=Lycorma delicatula TaxID=130591 RepID=UPI003F518F50
MVVFIGTLLVLCVIAFGISKLVETNSSVTKNHNFDKLQNRYLIVYYLATFSDWLQGPYVYKLYSDYGYDDDSIAILYITGFASSSLFGTVVGHVADKYGRKFLCASFGILYASCCLTKMSPQFNVLFFGRILGGISTSILFSTFEAWYVNEHLNYYKLPPEWLNITFGKAAFYTGLLAIIAGIVSQFLAETLQLGSVSPFLLAIPFLLVSTYIVIMTWNEHPPPDIEEDKQLLFFSALKLVFCKETILLLLGLIQSLYESVMYIFIFSWTPILDVLHPPLGLVFSIFMVAFMIGTKLYTLLISKRYRPQNLLTLTCAVGLVSYTTVTITISSSLHNNHSKHSYYLSETLEELPIIISFFSFVLYEMSVGLYFPAIGYLRGRVIPEKYRASVTNWFRVPMNIFTCFGLTLKQKDNKNDSSSVTKSTPHVINQYKFPLIFFICCIFLILTTITSTIFSKKYATKITKNEKEIKLEDGNPNAQDVINLYTENKKSVPI